MSYVTNEALLAIKEKITSDLSLLSKIYKAKKNDHHQITVAHNLVDDYEKDGWEIVHTLKTKTKLKKIKPHSSFFEDEVWCQFYELGYRTLNIDESLNLPFSNEDNDKKQIDVIAINDETAIIIECKSAQKPKKAPSYKDEFELLGLRLDGFRKVMQQIYGKDIKVKFVFATRNLRIDPDGVDMQRLGTTNSYHHSDGSFDYVKSLIKNYKGAAIYQFMGLLFDGQTINSNKIEIPAVEGDMGGLKYYMFSIEPGIMLKMGFVLHRTKANEDKMPTYQRLLVPGRLKGIREFIDGPNGEGGGFFPNSVIININAKNNKISFDASTTRSASSTASRSGILKLPNAYSIAYIIDGQHRLYGYAESKFKDTNTIPVVAFINLPTIKQLEMFMDINQNQKAVSPSLRLTLEKDLFWDSDRADSRIKALRSSIIQTLGSAQNSPLFNKIEIGEDSAILSSKPFATALMSSGLLPSAKGNKYTNKHLAACLYNTNNNDHDQEMNRSQKNICKLIFTCYDFVEENYSSVYNRDRYFILSNRGTFAFINIIGSLNSFLTTKGVIYKSSTPQARFAEMAEYLVALLDAIKNISKEREESLLNLIGAGADTKWLRFFQETINSVYQEYNPVELVEWKERNNALLQTEGREYGVAIERFMKAKVMEYLDILFGENLELEINAIKRNCQERAEKEMERYYKEFHERKEVDWTEMFIISEYKTIIEKYWTREVGENNMTFEKVFSLDIGFGFNSKADKTKWIAKFNSLRNIWAHEATKDIGLSKEEVVLLKKMHQHCIN